MLFFSSPMKKKGRKIDNKLKEVDSLIALIAKCYSGLLRSVRIAYLYTLLITIRELLTLTRKMRSDRGTTLFDDYDIDCRFWQSKLAGDITSLENILEYDTIKAALMDRNYLFPTHEQVRTDEKEYDFDQCDTLQMSLIGSRLWSNHHLLMKNILSDLNAIQKDLRVIAEEESQFEEELRVFENTYFVSQGLDVPWYRFPIIESLRSRYENVVETFEEEVWPTCKSDLREEIDDYFFYNQPTKELYQRFAKRKARNANSLSLLDPQEKCLFVEIYANRKLYGLNDLHDSLAYQKSMHLINAKIASFDLIEPASIKYNLLFVNKAAEELMIILVPDIKSYVPFPYSYSYAALLLAMTDFGITRGDSNNGIQMMNFVNKNLARSDEQIGDQTSITQKKKLLATRSFGKVLNSGFQGTRLDDASFERLRDTYWAAFTLFNAIFQKDIQGEGFDNYLIDPYESLATFETKLKETPEKRERLMLLKSVITGETDFL